VVQAVLWYKSVRKLKVQPILYIFSVIEWNVFEMTKNNCHFSKNVWKYRLKTVSWQVLIQLCDKWPKYFSDQNISTKNHWNASAKKSRTNFGKVRRVKCNCTLKFSITHPALSKKDSFFLLWLIYEKLAKILFNLCDGFDRCPQSPALNTQFINCLPCRIALLCMVSDHFYRTSVRFCLFSYQAVVVFIDLRWKCSSVLVFLSWIKSSEKLHLLISSVVIICNVRRVQCSKLQHLFAYKTGPIFTWEIVDILFGFGLLLFHMT